MKFMHLEEKSCIKRNFFIHASTREYWNPKKNYPCMNKYFFIMHSKEFPNPSVNKKNQILVSTEKPDPCSRKTK